MEHRVVITGTGTISPIGNSTEENWKNIKAGVCGIDEITAFDTENFSVKLAGEVKDFEPTLYMDFKEAKRMARFSQFAIAAADMAVKEAGLDLEKVEPTRFGVILGSGIGGITNIETEVKVLEEKGPRRVNPMFIPMIIGNMAAGNVAIRFGAKAACTSVVTACATGTHSIGEAFRQIKHGYADVMISGGTEASITPISVAGFASMTALSKSTDKLRASIPFDAERTGFVMGEGAGVVVLESLEHAKARGAKILAEVVGYGSTCDAYHITSPAPDGEGGARAMALAIEEAQIDKSQVSYINAHGTSTKLNDKFETAAIKKVFGEDAYKIPVSSTKSMTGHLLGAAGAVEAIYCVKAIDDSFIPATIGYKEADPECDLDVVPNEGRNVPVNYAMSNSLGFGGHNATLLFAKYSE
ncbi:MAG: beta-ketoacyl-[acyl-carrier-protein] synthase II [Lachnospiraceae bacterium]|nr:beta-ketoacyl-[acyl-carrier-protein] synthase II [Lachnospiraceae bacterium]